MLLRIVVMGSFHFILVWGQGRQVSDNPDEKYHNPKFFATTLDPLVDRGTDTRIPPLRDTPDFRVKAPMLEPWGTGWPYFETHRPYRLSPHTIIIQEFGKEKRGDLFGCYCTTVYRRYRLLAGCAVLTRRHIVTSAAATHLVLRKHRRAPNLDNILGAWYDIQDYNALNSSKYMTPARIYYHPMFTMPHKVNRTHPFPVMWDVAIWATQYQLHSETRTCGRASPTKHDLTSTVIDWGTEYFVMGFQFMRAYDRRPQPWYKYTVKLDALDRELPCPKTEWGWFRCLNTGSWAPLGVDIGAALHRNTKWTRYRNSGLIGLNVISLKLRSRQMISYFNDLNVHRNLEFIYNAYDGRLQNVYLDSRYEDTFKGAPVLKKGVQGPRDEANAKSSSKYSSTHCCFPESHRPGY